MPSRRPSAPALRESEEAQAKLDSLLLGCFSVQKLYGRNAGSFEAVNQVFHAIMADYPADRVVRAFELWMQRSQEFPTPSDIIGLIRRNGAPPLSKEVYISLNRRDPELRTGGDWAYIREYEEEMRTVDSQSVYLDPEIDNETRAENRRLRGVVRKLEEENRRLGELLRDARNAKPVEVVYPSINEKALKTIEFMRASGAKEQDIAEFSMQMLIGPQA